MTYKPQASISQLFQTLAELRKAEAKRRARAEQHRKHMARDLQRLET